MQSERVWVQCRNMSVLLKCVMLRNGCITSELMAFFPCKAQLSTSDLIALAVYVCMNVLQGFVSENTSTQTNICDFAYLSCSVSKKVQQHTPPSPLIFISSIGFLKYVPCYSISSEHMHLPCSFKNYSYLLSEEWCYLATVYCSVQWSSLQIVWEIWKKHCVEKKRSAVRVLSHTGSETIWNHSCL